MTSTPACREEEEVLEAAARAEHRAATAAVAAAAKAARQDVQQMQKAADRMAWHTQRWRLAAQRRKALEVSKLGLYKLCIKQ